MFKIATWNVNSLRVRLPHVLEWIDNHRPDVLALQETKMVDDNFPAADFNAIGYHSAYSGQKTYNGVATLSKSKQDIITTLIPGYDDPQKRVLGSLIDEICVLNLYVPNGSEVGSEKYRYKLEWLTHLKTYTAELLQKYPYCILLGDFNIAPSDEDVHDPEEWNGKVLCSEAERQAFSKLISGGLDDCFRLFPRDDKIYSWWDYRAAGFRRNRGLRIDHILASHALSERCQGCNVDISPRKLERPSDHAPVFAEFQL
jgi:exodeoxyribonuclease-3